jgi:hypothetical protein
MGAGLNKSSHQDHGDCTKCDEAVPSDNSHQGNGTSLAWEGDHPSWHEDLLGKSDQNLKCWGQLGSKKGI